MEHKNIIWIKQEDTEEAQFYASNVKVEELDQNVNQEFLQDPLKISWSTDTLKEDPDVKLEVGETKNKVMSSEIYALENTWFVGNNGNSCQISSEETLHQTVVTVELDEATEKSTHTHTEGLILQEDRVFSTRANCSLRGKDVNKFSCSFCLQNFATKYSLIMHVFIHIDGVQPPTYVCISCGEVFPNQYCLNKHLKITEDDPTLSCGNNEKYDAQENISFLKGVGEVAEKPHKCVGDETLSTTRSVNAQPAPLTVNRHHKCNLCGKYFKHPSHLKEHSLIHTGKKAHKCKICDKSFTLQRQLKYHTLIHTGKKPHKCDLCGKSFRFLRVLKSHESLHTGNSSHKCNICFKSYTDLSSLKIHSLRHSGKKPHECILCGKSFTQVGHLQSHILTHTGEKPHKCHVCGKHFAMLNNLKKHVFQHSGMKPYKCDTCGKSFTQLPNLRSHIPIHTGNFPYRCGTCGKPFGLLGTLKKHELIHTGIKPHKCNICERTFTLLHHLKRHAVVHTCK